MNKLKVADISASYECLSSASFDIHVLYLTEGTQPVCYTYGSKLNSV